MALNHASVVSVDPTRRFFPNEMAPLLRRLQSLSALAGDEITAVGALARRPIRSVAPLSNIHRKGDCPPPMTIVSGWACQQRILPDGRRQIQSFVLPGDIMGVMAPCLPASCDVVAFTRVFLVEATPLYCAASAGSRELLGMARSLRTMHLQNEWLLSNQIVRLGRLPAYERTANLLLELYYRLEGVGLAGQGQFACPLTHER